MEHGKARTDENESHESVRRFQTTDRKKVEAKRFSRETTPLIFYPLWTIGTMDARLQRLASLHEAPHDCKSGVAERAVARFDDDHECIDVMLFSLAGIHCGCVASLRSYFSDIRPGMSIGRPTSVRPRARVMATALVTSVAAYLAARSWRPLGEPFIEHLCFNAWRSPAAESPFQCWRCGWSAAIDHSSDQGPLMGAHLHLSQVYAQRRYTLGYVTRSGSGYTLP